MRIWDFDYDYDEKGMKEIPQQQQQLQQKQQKITWII